MSDGGGLSRWDSEMGYEISTKAIAEVCGDPHFSDACRASITRALAYIKVDPVQHSNFRDIGRMVLGTLALYLHASGGLTHRRLGALSSGGGILSAGRATAILLRLRAIGYVKATAKRINGSARLYVPTAKMIAAFRTRVGIELAGIALMEPRMNDFIALFESDDVLFRFYRLTGERLLDAQQRRHPALADFESIIARDAGMLTFFALFEAADTGGDFPPAGPLKISLADLARRFSVSRTHMLRLLRDAEKFGYVTRDAAGNYNGITTRLRDDFRLYYGIILITLTAMASGVTRELDASRRSLTA